MNATESLDIVKSGETSRVQFIGNKTATIAGDLVKPPVYITTE